MGKKTSLEDGEKKVPSQAKVLEALMEEINKKHGMNAIRRAVDLEHSSLLRIPSGSISLDIDLGGGIPIGRMTTIAGNYSTFKSTLCYHALRNAQQMRKKRILWEKYSTKDKPVYRWMISEDGDVPLTCAIIQSESESYTNEYAQALGVDIENLLVVYPESMEQGLEIALQLQRAGVEVILQDSYTAYTPGVVLNKETDDSYQLGLKAKIFGDYHGRYQAINNSLDRKGMIPCTLLCINQLREKIGGYGNPEYITGGRSVGHTQSVELRMRKGDYINIGTKDKPHLIGQTIKYKVEKNKTYKQYQTGEFDVYFDEGGPVPPGFIDNAKELIVLAMLYSIIDKSGSWYSYDILKCQGIQPMIEEIRKNPDIFAKLKAEVVLAAQEAEEVISFEEEEEAEEVVEASAFVKKKKVK